MELLQLDSKITSAQLNNGQRIERETFPKKIQVADRNRKGGQHHGHQGDANQAATRLPLVLVRMGTLEKTTGQSW